MAEMLRTASTVFALLSLLLLSAACSPGDTLILATTTSTQDSGLLDVLVSEFERRTGHSVKAIAVGSGQALRMGEEGEADVILAHAPEAEAEFMEAGYGIDSRPVMHNRFIIVGPPGDPANVEGLSALDALARIHSAGATFVSRGDRSGTHQKEMELWREAGLEPSGGWYVDTGQGMGMTLLVAFDRGGYTLTDNGTFLAFKDRLDLVPLVDGDPLLVNPYHVILVNPDQSTQVNLPAARDFAEFLLSPAGQDIIRTFGVEEHREPLFVPDTDG
jgi:tungstate transport system substrate-binding protein